MGWIGRNSHSYIITSNLQIGNSWIYWYLILTILLNQTNVQHPVAHSGQPDAFSCYCTLHKWYSKVPLNMEALPILYISVGRTFYNGLLGQKGSMRLPLDLYCFSQAIHNPIQTTLQAVLIAAIQAESKQVANVLWERKQLFLTVAGEAVILALNVSLKYKPIETTRQNGWLWETEQKPFENLWEAKKHSSSWSSGNCWLFLQSCQNGSSLQLGKVLRRFQHLALTPHYAKANSTFRLMSTFSFIFIATAKMCRLR